MQRRGGPMAPGKPDNCRRKWNGVAQPSNTDPEPDANWFLASLPDAEYQPLLAR